MSQPAHLDPAFDSPLIHSMARPPHQQQLQSASRPQRQRWQHNDQQRALLQCWNHQENGFNAPQRSALSTKVDNGRGRKSNRSNKVLRTEDQVVVFSLESLNDGNSICGARNVGEAELFEHPQHQFSVDNFVLLCEARTHIKMVRPMSGHTATE